MLGEEQLIEGCRKGDRTAQRQLYEKYSRRMFGICLRYCDSHEDAEEVLQEGLLKVFQKINDFRGQGNLEGWIKRIIINTSLDFYRRNKIRQAETEWNDNIVVSTEPMADYKAKDLLKVIQQLPKGFRTVFNLYAIEGYNHGEIGKMMGISEGTSKSQYARARVQLAKMLEKENRLPHSSTSETEMGDGLLPVVL